MDGGSQTIARDANGRFLPGSSGNPDGKRPGTRNRATLLHEVMREGDDRAMARLVVGRAVGGDAVAARFCLARLEPKPRGRPIALDLPEGARSIEAVDAAFDSALAQLAAGAITPTEAVEIARFLERRTRALRAWAKEEAKAGRLSTGNIDEPTQRNISSPRVSGERSERASDPGEGPVAAGAIAPASSEEAEAPPLPNLSPRGEEKRPLVHLHSACNSRLPTPHLMRHVLLGTTAYRSLAAG